MIFWLTTTFTAVSTLHHSESSHIHHLKIRGQPKNMSHRHFGKEIAAFDIHTQRMDLYGEGDEYKERVMLIYDGLHYDALAIAGETFTSQYSKSVSYPPHHSLNYRCNE